MMKSCAGRPGGGRAGGVRTTLSPGGGLGNSPRALVRADELLTKATGEESEQTVLSIHGTMALRKTEKSSTKQNRPVAQHKTHRQKQQVGFKIARAVGHGPSGSSLATTFGNVLKTRGLWKNTRRLKFNAWASCLIIVIREETHGARVVCQRNFSHDGQTEKPCYWLEAST